MSVELRLYGDDDEIGAVLAAIGTVLDVGHHRTFPGLNGAYAEVALRPAAGAEDNAGGAS